MFRQRPSDADDEAIHQHAVSRRMIITGGATAGALALAAPVLGGTESAGAAVPDQLFDVKAFGAKGNGIADDTAAIQAAVKACVGGGTVWFPTGLYLTSAAIDISEKPGICLAGPKGGPYYKWGALDMSDRSGAVLMLTRNNQVGISSDRTGRPTVLHQGPVIEGLTVIGKPGTKGTVGYKNVGVNRFTLRNCGFFFLDTGVKVAFNAVLGASGEWGMIDQCSVSNCVTYGLDIDAPGLTVIGGEYTASGKIANIIIRENSANVRLMGLKVNVGLGDGIVCLGTLSQLIACNVERDNAGVGSHIKMDGAATPLLSGHSNVVIGCAVSGKKTGTGVTVMPNAHYTSIVALTAYDVGVSVKDSGVCTTMQNSSGDFKFPAKIGFYGTNPVARQAVSGSRGGNAALTSLLASLAATGLISNNTTP